MRIKRENRKQWVLLIAWIAISLLLVLADYITPNEVDFHFTFLVPVALASWYNGRTWGIPFAVGLSFVRFVFFLSGWDADEKTIEALSNLIITLLVFGSFSIMIDFIAKQTKELAQEVGVLEGLLPICASCKKIRDENQQWQQLEKYVTEHTAATFTHGICPDCMKRDFPASYKKMYPDPGRNG
jgi:K+-sensing histidine kinase KdpD